MRMQVEYRKVGELKHYPGNPRMISGEMLLKLRKSIREFGLVDPLVINKNNEVVGGNQRLKAAIGEGIKEVPVVIVELNKDKERALNLALNKIQGEWDEELLKEFMERLSSDGIDLSGFDKKELQELDLGIEGGDDNYTRKVDPPIYKITGENPKIADLYDDSVYRGLIAKINKASLDDEVKSFLRLAATRFIKFRYDKIAEFYAHGNEELQGLMEDLALVIVDFSQAIEKGFIKMTKMIIEEYSKEYEQGNE